MYTMTRELIFVDSLFLEFCGKFIDETIQYFDGQHNNIKRKKNDQESTLFKIHNAFIKRRKIKNLLYLQSQ